MESYHLRLCCISLSLTLVYVACFPCSYYHQHPSFDKFICNSNTLNAYFPNNPGRLAAEIKTFHILGVRSWGALETKLPFQMYFQRSSQLQGELHLRNPEQLSEVHESPRQDQYRPTSHTGN